MSARSNVSIFIASMGYFAWLCLLSPILGSSPISEHTTYILASQYIFSSLGYGILKYAISKFKFVPQFLFCPALFLSIYSVKIIVEKMPEVKGAFGGYASLNSPDQIWEWVELFKLFFAVGISGLFYSIFVGYRFLNTANDQFIRIYMIQVIASIIGLVATIYLISIGGWLFAASFILASALLHLLCEFKLKKTQILILALPILTLVWPIAYWLEPRVSLNYSARDFNNKLKVEELSKNWDINSKIQLLRLQNENDTRYLVSIGNGLGHSWVTDYQFSNVPTELQIAASFKPNNVLLFFAGTSHEVLAYRKINPAMSSITSVELQPKIREMGSSVMQKAFLNYLKPADKILTEDVRHYLETTDNLYDQIIFSWSGSAIIQHAGAVMQTTSYAFTIEGINQALSHLSNYGTAVTFGGPIYQFLSCLLTLLGENETTESIVILRESSWKRPLTIGWDRRILIYKKNGWKSADLNNLAKKVSELGSYEIEYSPSQNINWKIMVETQQAFSKVHLPKSDNNPYVYSRGPENPILFASIVIIVFSLFVLWLLFVFSLPNRAIKFQNTNMLFIAFLLGAAYSSLGIYSLHKLILFIGQPTLALVIYYSATLLGQYFCYLYFKDRHTFIRLRLGQLGLLLWLIFAILLAYYSNAIFKFNLFEKYIIVSIFLFLCTFFSSNLFLSLLYHPDGAKYATGILSLNTLSAGLMILVSPIFIQSLGLIMLSFTGILAYFLGARLLTHLMVIRS